LFAEIIRLLIAAACALFVLSLPLSKTETGAALRRVAAVCFTLAFLPSLIIGLFYARPAATDTASSAAPASGSDPQALLADLGCIALVVIVAFVAYMILKLRSRFVSKAKTRDPWEAFFHRGGGKRPFTMHTSARRSRSPFTDDDEDESA